MVGVGGRSKACDNCYRRRIKCDETKPKCNNCTRSKLECGGIKAMTIIHYEGQPRRTSNKNEGRVAALIRTPSSQSPASSNDSTATGIARAITPAADELFINYTLANLSSGRKLEIVDSRAERDLSDKALLALATFFYGREHKQQPVIQYGLRRYGKALEALNLALGDVSQQKSYDVLESVIVLAMFEYLMSDRPDGWIAHCIGLERLFETRGPELFTSTAERTILERSRTSIVISCLVLRKPTIMSQPNWKTIPWRASPNDKPILERLVDILADCPDLLILQDKMYASSPTHNSTTIATTLHQQAQSLKLALAHWKQTWETSEPTHRWVDPSTTTSPPETEVPQLPLPLPPFTYKSLFHANATTMQAAIGILIERVLQSTHPYLPSTTLPDNNNNNRDSDSADLAYTHAIDIARSAEYCVSHAGLGSFYILFPLRMAWVVVSGRDRELTVWLEAILQRIRSGAAGHWAVAGYLLDIARDGAVVVPGFSERGSGSRSGLVLVGEGEEEGEGRVGEEGSTS